jgi:hypothetical protein
MALDLPLCGASAPATSHAIAGTGMPDVGAVIIARRTRTGPCVRRRTIGISRLPSSSVSRRAHTGPGPWPDVYRNQRGPQG